MRPLVMFTWWLEFKLFGQNPLVSHAINVILYSINVLLVQALAWFVLHEKINKHREWFSTLAAAIYAVHPMLIESTAWISGRFDVLCTTGILSASLVMVLPLRSSLLKTMLVTIFVSISLLSKELGVMAPLVLLCVWMACNAREDLSLYANIRHAFESNKCTWMALGLVLVVYFILRHLSMGEVYHEGLEVAHYKSLVSSTMPLEALWHYIYASFLPFGEVSVYHPPSLSPGAPAFYIAGFLSILVVLVVLWKSFYRQRSWAWLLLACFAGIFLVLHFIPMTIQDNIAHDRFMTLPLAFFGIAMVCLPWEVFNSALLSRKIIISFFLAVGGWLILMTVTTVSMVGVWRSDFILWSWTYSIHPDVASLRRQYIMAAFREGRTDLVKKEIEGVNKKYGLTMGEQSLYADLLIQEGDREAKNYLEGMLSVFPRDSSGGIAYDKSFNRVTYPVFVAYARAKLIFDGDVEAAMKNLDAAAERVPLQRRVDLNYARATVFYAMNRFDDADDLVRRTERERHPNQHLSSLRMRTDLAAYCNNQLRSARALPQACTKLRNSGFFHFEE
ncbi:MAG: hypothetical protein Q4G71_12135 [Pseudomonadota bacterium]|nr:hypothetical protein [Pseudomonadota bacterium]